MVDGAKGDMMLLGEGGGFIVVVVLCLSHRQSRTVARSPYRSSLPFFVMLCLVMHS
jgi:hypothetical protein